MATLSGVWRQPSASLKENLAGNKRRRRSQALQLAKTGYGVTRENNEEIIVMKTKRNGAKIAKVIGVS